MSDPTMPPGNARAAAASEAKLRAHLLQQPGDINALSELGVLYAEAGRFGEGLELLERAMELQPQDPRLCLVAAGIAANHGDLETAERAYHRALKLRPGLAHAHVGLGQIAEAFGRTSSAEKQFRAALDDDPDHVDGLLGLARIRLAEKQPEQAVHLFAHVTQIYPQHARALSGHAQALMQMGAPEQAARPLKRALEIDPTLRSARLLLGHVEMNRGEVQAAEMTYRKAIANGEDHADVQVGLGDALRVQGRMPEALQAYDAALKLRPEDEILSTLRATCLVAMNRHAEAVAELRQWVARQPRCTAPRLMLSDMLNAMGRAGEVTNMWRDAASNDEADPLAYAELALLHERMGSFEAAAMAASSSHDDSRPGTILMRARVALRGHDYSIAKRELLILKGVSLPAAMARERFRLLGLVYDHAEQRTEAVLAFREAHRIEATPLPTLATGEDLRAGMHNLLRLPVLEKPRETAPVLLLGLPGSGVERLAALLADQARVAVREDRFGSQTDFFGNADESAMLMPMSQSQLAVQARRYSRARQRHVAGTPAVLIDWLPVFDARVLPLARCALPGLRAIVVDADPEQAFLRWLAFGWQRQLRISDTDHAAGWWRIAREQIDLAAEVLPCARVNADAVLDDPVAHGSELASFLGLQPLQSGPLVQQRSVSSSGLPSRFATGHSKHYRSVLAKAFAALRCPD